MTYAVMIDGAFLRKRYEKENSTPSHRTHLTEDSLIHFCDKLGQDPLLKGMSLFRIYYYDAVPYGSTTTHPLTGATKDFGATPTYSAMKKFLDQVSLKPNVAFRKGELSFSGWSIRPGKLQDLECDFKQGKPFNPSYLTASLKQKGVDMKIGLDIAWISSKRIVNTLVLVTGDADFVPAMKFARREGVRVYLCSLEHSVSKTLKIHTDQILQVDLTTLNS